MKFELKYDLRNPLPWERPWAEVYRHFLNQVEWADQHGFAVVNLHEHHFAEDGYLPAPFVAAAAIAARTERIRIRLNVVLLPLHHPVEVAEQVAVLDSISNGRVDLVVAGGSRPEEFAGYGVDRSERGSRLEEGVLILKQALRGDTFDARGRHYDLAGVSVRPRPTQQPAPKVFMGGSSKVAARRAARIADGFLPTVPPLVDVWRSAMIELGQDPDSQVAFAMLPAIGPKNFLHIAQEPETAWEQIAPFAEYESASYAQWAGGSATTVFQAADAESLWSSGDYGVLTPDETIELCRRLVREKHPERLVMHPMMGGMPYDLGQSSLQLLVDHVMPEFEPEDGAAR